VLQNDEIDEILARAMEKQFSRARPSTRHFFDHQTAEIGQPRAVTIHKWVIAALNDYDTRQTVELLANSAVKEIVAVGAKLTGEVVFRSSRLLPCLPAWEDGDLLFNRPADDRFGVKGGNVVKSVNCFVDDVATAAARLQQLDSEYPGDERLQLFCAKPLEKKLIRATVKAKIPCRVFGLYNYKTERSWVLTRDLSACSLYIGQPAFDLPVKGNKLVVGARFVVWINDPRYAVCVTP
jgi:hypothetical protein